MSPYNLGASTTGADPSAAPDTQTVIGLLGSLMPLLLQIQLQSRDQMYLPSPMPIGPLPMGSMPPGPAPTGQPASDQAGLGYPLGNIAPFNPMLDHQAATHLVEDITADSLRTLSTFLEAYAPQHRGLESCIPIVTQAARCFAARNHAQTFALIWQAYRVITALRAANPQLPPLRQAGPAGASFPSTTPIIH
jgi:hypothetical protein